MTNGEKYKDLLLKENDFCKEFLIPIVLKNFGMNCNCIKCSQCNVLTTIFLSEEYQEPETDWSKVPVDTPIFVRDYETVDWIPRYFARYENGKIFAWKDGTTSFTNKGERPIEWTYAKLAEDDPT